MSRVAPIEPGTITAAAPIEARLLNARGQISPLYQVLLNSVAAADGWEQLMTIVRQRLSLSSRLRELVILRIAVLNHAPYEFEAHVPHARAAGITDAEMAALREAAPPGFDTLDSAVIAYCDAMTIDVHVDDARYGAVSAQFDAPTMVELTVTIAAYNMVSRLLSALDIR